MSARDEYAGGLLAAQQWNEQHPIGTQVAAFLVSRDEPPLMTRTISVAWPLVHGGACVRVEGHASALHLTHVDAAEGGAR
jgi:hypothetical protein